MNLIFRLLVMFLLSGGGGSYYGGPVFGGERLGLVLVIYLIIYFPGGFWAKP